MIRVVVIGSGNIAESLSIALRANSSERLELVQISARNLDRLSQIGRVATTPTSSLDELAAADLYILAVSDGAVELLARELPFSEGSKVVHTAGCVTMDSVDGVLYPMQSFTAGRAVDFRTVPLFIEGDPIVEAVAHELSDSVMWLDSERRKALHLAAVFSCNFVNSMFIAAQDVLSRYDLDFEHFRPLVEQTVSKVFDSGLTPRECQTGVARRGDEASMERHLAMLEGDDNLVNIYKNISKYIWETSKKI